MAWHPGSKGKGEWSDPNRPPRLMRGGRGFQGTSPSEPKSRFAAFNPDERMILETLLQDHANTVSTISRSIEPTPEGAYKYLAAIEELENECRKVG